MNVSRATAAPTWYSTKILSYPTVLTLWIVGLVRSALAMAQQQHEPPLHIVFLTTGGTIDKDYPHSTGGWAFTFGEAPAVTRILAHAAAAWTHDVRQVCQKDSLEITDADRAQMWSVLQEIVQAQHEHEHDNDKDVPRRLAFIVTHGTDTLLDTARYLQARIQQQHAAATNSNVTYAVAVTGAMRPQRFSNSDAPFNVGMAVAAVQKYNNNKKGHDVYVCIQGLCHTATDLQRDAATGKFYY